MKGLLLKDWYLAKKYMKSYLAIIILLLGLCLFIPIQGGIYGCFYSCMICSLLPYYFLAYDEKSGWEQYCCTLPVTRAEFVTAKYLTGLIPSVIVIPAAALCVVLGGLLRDELSFSYIVVLLPLMILYSAFLGSISNMLIFRYGTVHNRLVFFLLVGCSVALGLFLFGRIVKSAESVLWPVAAGGILFYVLSWYLSIQFYKKRELG